MKPVSSDLPHHGTAQNVTRVPPRLAAVHSSIVSCERCPRLRAHCRRVAREKKRAHRHDAYWGRPVPGFGDPDARLLLVGLAPAAHGANRTGRVFTGDGSGDFLMSALHRTGFANIATSRHADDGLQLTDAYILSAVRCAPPDNKPLPEEIARCLDHLDAELEQLPHVRVVVALGKIGFDAWLQRLRRHGVLFSRKPPFGHGVVALPGEHQDRVPALVGCYHPSRQNTNTGRLTARMMESVLRKARRLLDRPRPVPA
ncbi:MAG: uracil-DNA glycosylase [Acidobacteria bacterium]|nr:uracil-DNA glycosylase [Acidobacteriota bacterium]